MSKVLSLQDLIGQYEVLVTMNKKYACRYKLTINARAEFTLDETMSGQFGSTGITWEGNVVPDQQVFTLQVEKCIDWSFTFQEEEITKRGSLIKKRFSLIPVPGGIKVVLELPRIPVTLSRKRF